jgi:hypothetical protein
MNLSTVTGLLVMIAGVQAMHPLNLKPKWRSFLEEVLAESDRADLNIFGRAVDLDDIDRKVKKAKKTITYHI